MPIIKLGDQHRYFMIEFDENGREVADTRMSVNNQVYNQTSEAIQAAVLDGVTDVFLISHGFMDTQTGAEDSYRTWFSMMQSQFTAENLSQGTMKKLLAVGIHWPAGFLKNNDGYTDTTSTYSGEPVLLIASSADVAKPPLGLGSKILSYFTDLRSAAGAWGTTKYDAIIKHFQNFVYRIFGRYETTAIEIGKGPVFDLIKKLQQATIDADKTVRFHLSGHSLGSHIVSAAVCGPSDGDLVFGAQKKESNLPLLIHSVSLIQAAVPNNAMASGGIYSRLMSRVAGPIVATNSVYDRALGIYKITSPETSNESYGAEDQKKLTMRKNDRKSWNYRVNGTAIGRDGVSADTPSWPIKMLKPEEVYDANLLPNGKITTVNSDNFITLYGYTLNPFNAIGHAAVGAHTNIAHPAVAHLIWSAAELSTRTVSLESTKTGGIA